MSCHTNNERCQPQYSTCCEGYVCVKREDDTHRCVPSQTRQSLHQNCVGDVDCTTGFCQKPSCEAMQALGIPKELCYNMGVCAKRPI